MLHNMGPLFVQRISFVVLHADAAALIFFFFFIITHLD